MKLIDLLVKKTFEEGWTWPVDSLSIAQDGCGICWGYDCENLMLSVGGRTWRSRSGSNIIAGSSFPLPELSEDWNSSFITRTQYEAALAKNDGWIEWGGGECPVHGTVYVDVKLRSGHVTTERRAYSLDWNTPDGDDAIIAYRLHSDIESRDNDDQLEQDLNECIGQGVGPAWHGEGLPPVGAKCEYSLNSGATWFKCKIDYILGTQGLVMLADVFEGGQWVSFHEYDGKLKFRPIRTEAEKAREKSIKEIDLACKECAHVDAMAEHIYESIAAGNISGIKLEAK